MTKRYVSIGSAENLYKYDDATVPTLPSGVDIKGIRAHSCYFDDMQADTMTANLNIQDDICHIYGDGDDFCFYYDSGTDDFRIDSSTTTGILILDKDGNLTITGTLTDSGGGGSGAPADSQYVTLSTNATLTQERVLTGTADQIVVTDGGAGTTVTLSLPQDLDTAADLVLGSLEVNGDVECDTLTLEGTSGMEVSRAAVGQILFKGQLAGAGNIYRFTSLDADGTDSIGLRVSSLYGGANEKYVSIASNTGANAKITSNASGTGTAAALELHANSNTEQILLNIDGTIDMKIGSLEIGVDDTTKGDLYLYGSSGSGGGTARLYSGATVDTETDYYEMLSDGFGRLLLRAVGGTNGTNSILFWNDVDATLELQGSGGAANFGGNLTVDGKLNLGAQDALTISGGAITPTAVYNSIAPESGTADNLDDITCDITDFFILRNSSSSNTITVRHAVGNIRCSGSANITLNNSLDAMLCFKAGTTVFCALVWQN